MHFIICTFGGVHQAKLILGTIIGNQQLGFKFDVIQQVFVLEVQGTVVANVLRPTVIPALLIPFLQNITHIKPKQKTVKSGQTVKKPSRHTISHVDELVPNLIIIYIPYSVLKQPV